MIGSCLRMNICCDFVIAQLCVHRNIMRHARLASNIKQRLQIKKEKASQMTVIPAILNKEHIHIIPLFPAAIATLIESFPMVRTIIPAGKEKK